MDPFFTVGNLESFTVVEFQTQSLMSGVELQRIEQALYKLVEDGAIKLLIDFSKVEYLSSQAIGLIVALRTKTSKAPGGKLALCGIGPSLQQLLKITALDRVLSIYKSRREAVKAK